jgi:RimJ/RimL family protein N-acetyltransferase
VAVNLTYVRVADEEHPAVVAFLCADEWPFHGLPHLSVEAAHDVVVSDAETESFWIRSDGEEVGLVRLLDLADLDDGSPLFDIRIAAAHRGRGVGTAAVHWLSAHLFGNHPMLHRIEATTRGDNGAMQTVFDRCGYRQEGVLREAWRSANGDRHDTLIYGLLRHEWLTQT